MEWDVVELHRRMADKTLRITGNVLGIVKQARKVYGLLQKHRSTVMDEKTRRFIADYLAVQYPTETWDEESILFAADIIQDILETRKVQAITGNKVVIWMQAAYVVTGEAAVKILTGEVDARKYIEDHLPGLAVRTVMISEEEPKGYGNVQSDKGNGGEEK